MSSSSYKNILILCTAWLLLYVIAVYSVGWALNYGGSRYWATPIWILLYFLPGYLSGYLFHNNWFTTGAVIGVLGTMLWLLHAQLTIASMSASINVIANTVTSILGAWLGQRMEARKCL